MGVVVSIFLLFVIAVRPLFFFDFLSIPVTKTEKTDEPLHNPPTHAQGLRREQTQSILAIQLGPRTKTVYLPSQSKSGAAGWYSSSHQRVSMSKRY